MSSGWAPVVYGNFDERETAALYVNCNNGGGTADGVLAYAQAIFQAAPGGPKLIGIVVPRKQPPDQLPTLLGVSFGGDEIIAREAFYGHADGTCCPSGEATTVWKLSRGTLVAVSTRVTKEPVHS